MDKNELHKYVIGVASKSPAKKRKVGAVVARYFDGQYSVIAEGFNEALDGGSCEDVNGETRDCVVHAEVNCLESMEGEVTNDMVMYVTHQPCNGCLAALKSWGMAYEVVGEFMKFDSGKPRMHLVPASLNVEVAKVLTYGAKKYKEDNWRNVEDLQRYADALERHLGDWKDGVALDPESGLMHLSHMACNLAFLIELTLKHNLPMRKI